MATARRRTAVALAVPAAGAGCSKGGRSSGGFASVAPGSSASVTSLATTASSTSSGVSSTTPVVGNRIEVLPRGISIDGKRRLLLAGEIQYYRIRDKGFDVA